MIRCAVAGCPWVHDDTTDPGTHADRDRLRTDGWAVNFHNQGWKPYCPDHNPLQRITPCTPRS